jgi:hypothetical protein
VTVSVEKIDIVVYTSTKGYFEFNAPYGTYTVKFEKEEFEPFETQITVSTSEYDMGKIKLKRIAVQYDFTKWFAENLLLIFVLTIIIIALCIAAAAARKSAKAKKAEKTEKIMFQYPTDMQMLRRYLWQYDRERGMEKPPPQPPQLPSETEYGEPEISLKKLEEQKVLQYYIGGGKIKNCPLCNKPNPDNAVRCYSCGASIW